MRNVMREGELAEKKNFKDVYICKVFSERPSGSCGETWQENGEGALSQFAPPTEPDPRVTTTFGSVKFNAQG